MAGTKTPTCCCGFFSISKSPERSEEAFLQHMAASGLDISGYIRAKQLREQQLRAQQQMATNSARMSPAVR